jgi:DNA-binding response OmpR family regulator
MLNVGHVLTIDAIINQVWGAEGSDRESLRQLIRRLRSKISQSTALASVSSDLAPYIETVPGLGYGLVLPAFVD